MFKYVQSMVLIRIWSPSECSKIFKSKADSRLQEAKPSSGASSQRGWKGLWPSRQGGLTNAQDFAKEGKNLNNAFTRKPIVFLRILTREDKIKSIELVLIFWCLCSMSSWPTCHSRPWVILSFRLQMYCILQHFRACPQPDWDGQTPCFLHFCTHFAKVMFLLWWLQKKLMFSVWWLQTKLMFLVWWLQTKLMFFGGWCASLPRGVGGGGAMAFVVSCKQS